MSYHRIYKYTSIGRPLEPDYPTNKAVLLLIPLAALLGAVMAWMGGSAGGQILQAAISFALIAFGSWALARELFPDDNPAAFISMAMALLTDRTPHALLPVAGKTILMHALETLHRSAILDVTVVSPSYCAELASEIDTGPLIGMDVCFTPMIPKGKIRRITSS